MNAALAQLEKLQGQKLAPATILCSSPSAPAQILHARHDGHHLEPRLNDESVKALAERTQNPRFAYDSYRRLIQMFGNVVLDIEKAHFEEVFDGKKKQKKAKLDTDLNAAALLEVIASTRRSSRSMPDRLPAEPLRSACDGPRRRFPLLAE